MSLGAIISKDSVFINLEANSKADVLQKLAIPAAKIAGISADVVFKKLEEREKLSSTGAGRGVAIPHGRMDEVQHVFGLFAKLATPVDFDAADDKPVDLVFLLMAPSNSGAEHLKALSRVSRLMRDEVICARLRECKSAEDAYKIIAE